MAAESACRMTTPGGPWGRRCRWVQWEPLHRPTERHRQQRRPAQCRPQEQQLLVLPGSVPVRPVPVRPEQEPGPQEPGPQEPGPQVAEPVGHGVRAQRSDAVPVAARAPRRGRPGGERDGRSQAWTTRPCGQVLPQREARSPRPTVPAAPGRRAGQELPRKQQRPALRQRRAQVRWRVPAKRARAAMPPLLARASLRKPSWQRPS